MLFTFILATRLLQWISAPVQWELTKEIYLINLSDIEISRCSGILCFLEDDSAMADKGSDVDL